MTKKTPGKMTPCTLDTITAYAAHRKRHGYNSSRQYISKLYNKNDPRIVKIGKKINREKSDEIFYQLSGPPENEPDTSRDKPLSPGQPPNSQPPGKALGVPSIVESKALKDFYSAKNEELKYKKDANELVKFTDISDKIFSVLRPIRDDIQAMSKKIGLLSHAAKSGHASVQIIQKEADRILLSRIGNKYEFDDELKKKITEMLTM